MNGDIDGENKSKKDYEVDQGIKQIYSNNDFEEDLDSFQTTAT